MKIQCQSIIICRKPRKKTDHEVKVCCIKLFEENNPHLSAKLPKEEREFEDVQNVVIKGYDTKLVLEGNDLIVNNIVSANVNHHAKAHEVWIEKA